MGYCVYSRVRRTCHACGSRAPATCLPLRAAFLAAHLLLPRATLLPHARLHTCRTPAPAYAVCRAAQHAVPPRLAHLDLLNSDIE